MRGTGQTGQPRWRAFVQNAALVVASFAVVLLLFEFVVFRFILLAPDVPERTTIGGVVRYVPGQSGVHRVQDDVAAPFTINAQGWNSSHRSYLLERTPDVPRIAVIGDSMVEAFQVPPQESFVEQMEQRFSADGQRVEAYRFGMGGAPLSQHITVLESEVLKYAPDVVVVLLIHNDFHESFYRGDAEALSAPTAKRSMFMRLQLDQGRVVREVPPSPYVRTWTDTFRQLATYRFLRYREQLSLPFITAAILGEANREQMIANVYVSDIERNIAGIRTATDHIFGRLASVSREHGIRLLLAMDGHRAAIYDGSPAGQEAPLALNAIAAEFAARHEIPFIDLHPYFEAHWRQHRQRFEFPSDGHWNRLGHQIAAEAIHSHLRNALSSGPQAARVSK